MAMAMKGRFKPATLVRLVLWLAILGPTVIFFGSKLRFIPAEKILPTIVFLTVFTIIPILVNQKVLVPRFLKTEQYRQFLLCFGATVLVFGLILGYGTLLIYKFVLQPGYIPTLLYLTFVNAVQLLLSMLLFTALDLGIDWLKQRELRKAQELERLKSEVQYLKAQINPHFLFNTLNNLYALTLTKSDNAPKMVLKLSEMMEYMVYHSNEPLVPVQKELDYLHNYIELEKLRCQWPEKIRFETEGVTNDFKIAPLLLLPFVENGFKHGIYKQGQHAELNIKVQLTDGKLTLAMQNSVAEVSAPATENTTRGFGLENVRKRLNYLYQENHELETIQADGYYKVNLNVPLA